MITHIPTKKLVTALIIAAISIAVIFALYAHRNTGEKPLTIGALLILSGENAAWGEAAKKGIDLALDKWRGAHPRQPIQIIYEDTAGQPKQAVIAYQKLATIDKVDAVIGPLYQVELAAITPIIQKSPLPIIAPNYAPLADRPDPRNPLLIWMDTSTEAERIAEYAYKEGARQIAVVGTKDPWETEVTNTFSRKFESLGGTISYQDLVQQDANDVKFTITKAVATKSDAIFLGTYYQFIHSLKAISDLGYRGRLFGIEVDAYLAGETKGASNGLQFIAPDFYTSDFVTQFKARYHEKPGIPAGQAYDATKILLSFLEKSRARADILDAMRNLKTYEGASGEIIFTPDGKTLLPTAIFELQNGNVRRISAE